MINVGITMTVKTLLNGNEVNFCIDKNWFSFLQACDINPVLLNYEMHNDQNLLKTLNIRGIILSGGNTLYDYGGDAKKRDDFEYMLLEYTKNNDIPLLGVCRGMQIIQHYFGIKLEKVDGHVNTKHNISFRNQNIIVNSYHHYGAFNTVNDLNILAKSQDGVVEAVQHNVFSIIGVMWHPERSPLHQDYNKKLFTEHFVLCCKNYN